MAGEIVERVAQALLAVFEAKEQFSEEECPRAFARAAIEAMREPTDEMVYMAWRMDSVMSSAKVWRTMIDEALK